MTATNHQPDDRAEGILLAAALLFVADLFLGWQRVGVRVAGVMDLGVTSSGWSGWGLIAGACALAVAGLASFALWRGVSSPGSTLLAAIGMLLAAALAVPADGHGAGMMVTPMADIRVGAVLWPAWAGLALAVLVAAVACVAFLASARSGVRPLWRIPPAPPSPR